MGSFIYNYLSGKENNMNLNNRKTKRLVSSIIIIILVLAMVIPSLISILY